MEEWDRIARERKRAALAKSSPSQVAQVDGEVEDDFQLAQSLSRSGSSIGPQSTKAHVAQPISTPTSPLWRRMVDAIVGNGAQSASTATSKSATSSNNYTTGDYAASYPPHGDRMAKIEAMNRAGAMTRSTPDLNLTNLQLRLSNNDTPTNVRRALSAQDFPQPVGLLQVVPLRDERWSSISKLLERRDHEIVRMRLCCMLREERLPEGLHGPFWKIISGAQDCIKKNAGLYEVLVSRESPSYEYKIMKDVNRTLPELPFYRTEGGVGQKRLFNILKAYAVLDQELGYCQSMSYIAAVLLLYLDEQEAFWVLCQLIKQYSLEGYFQKGLPTLRLALFQFDKLIEHQLPKLFFHFKTEGVTPLLYASEWFSTLYVYNFPLPLVVRLWDVLFIEGTAFLFKIALAVLALSQDLLLSLSFEEILQTLKNKHTHDALEWDELIRVADVMTIVDKPMLDSLEDRYKNPKTSLFRIDTL